MNRGRLEELPQATEEQIDAVRSLVEKRFDPDEQLTILQILGIEGYVRRTPLCKICGYTMRKGNGKSWDCGRCKHRRAKEWM